MFNDKVFDAFPQLNTERLTLRALTSSDVAALFRMRSSGRLNQFIARENMDSQESAAELLQRVEKTWTDKNGIAWAGVLRGDGEIIGTCGFNQIDKMNMRAEIGGELSVDYWGKNLAIEAVEAIVEFGFNNMQLHSIEAKVSPLNRGAVFLLETLGFEKEAHYKDRVFFRNAFSDLAVYTCFNNK